MTATDTTQLAYNDLVSAAELLIGTGNVDNVKCIVVLPGKILWEVYATDDNGKVISAGGEPLVTARERSVEFPEAVR